MPEDMYYGKLQHQFYEHYNRGDYQQALDYLEANAPAVTGYNAITTAWKAGMHCLTGDGAGGLRLLQEAYDAGIWYHEEALANDPDYALLHDNPDFQKLLTHFHKRRLAETSELVPHLTVLEPPDFTPHPWPLLLALHGNGGSAGEFASHFKAVTKQGWLVALPQSHEDTWVSDHYDWRDYSSACNDLQNHIKMLKNRCEIDRIVLAGYSMGGQIAMQAALSGDIPARGFIGLEGWIFDDDLFQHVLEHTMRRDLRVYLVSGTDPDFCFWAHKVQEQLVEAGIACKLELTNNEYHRVPVEINGILKRAFEFICEGT